MIASNGLHVEFWGAPLDSCAGTVVAVHGITANAHALHRLAMHLDPSLCVIAPDLRGRGGSRTLQGPFGIAQHADDVAHVVTELGIVSTMWIGHSMGAFVSAMAAVRHPELVSSLVMIDGGLPAPVPPNVAPQEALAKMMGPTIERLRMSFDTFDDYVAFWETHPAMREIDEEYLREYSGHDVDLNAHPIQSIVNADAVWADGEELMVNEDVRNVASQVNVPILLCRATRGILNQPEPRIPESQAREFASKRTDVRILEVPDSNHFSIIAAPHAVTMVAAAIHEEGVTRVAH